MKIILHKVEIVLAEDEIDVNIEVVVVLPVEDIVEAVDVDDEIIIFVDVMIGVEVVVFIRIKRDVEGVAFIVNGVIVEEIVEIVEPELLTNELLIAVNNVLSVVAIVSVDKGDVDLMSF